MTESSSALPPGTGGAAARAQSDFHTSDHDYTKGSPHLTHASLRSLIDRKLSNLVSATLAAKGRCHVLEVGAGHGTFTDALLTVGATVTVTEASKGSAERLLAKYAGHPQVTVMYDESGEEILASGRSFDGACCIAVLHHIPDYVSFVNNLATKINADGWLFAAQDPLYYPRMPKLPHALQRGSFYTWRLSQGNYVRGIKTRLRRLRGVWDETNPSDMVEYHVLRDGVDEVALEDALAGAFQHVETFRYWSTPSAILQRTFERTRLVTEFGIVATKRRPTSM